MTLTQVIPTENPEALKTRDGELTLSTEECEEVARIALLYRSAKGALAQAEQTLAVARTQLDMLGEATRARLAALGIEPEAIAEDRLIVKPDGSVHYTVA